MSVTKPKTAKNTNLQPGIEIGQHTCNPSPKAKRCYVPQTTQFTCGPAAGLAALRLAGVVEHTEWVDELLLWRDANSIFMGAGQAGCEPHALAVALRRRGAEISLWEKGTAVLFDKWTRHPDHRSVATVIRQADQKAAADLGIHWNESPFDMGILLNQMAQGWVPVVLGRDGRTLHWQTVYKAQGDSMVLIDPYINGVPQDLDAEPVLRIIPKARLGQLLQHGRQKAHAIILVRKPA